MVIWIEENGSPFYGKAARPKSDPVNCGFLEKLAILPLP
jgi:hypothetical protein